MINDLLADKGLKLREGTIVDAAIYTAVPAATKNALNERRHGMNMLSGGDELLWKSASL
ncbi:hypothetical protein NRR22_003665 [Salmonella enterica]|nr:hypothetical protein [Salmonella enterica]